MDDIMTMQEEAGLEMLIQQSPWYDQPMSLDDVRSHITANYLTIKRSFIAIGFYLKKADQDSLYLDAGYSSVWDFAHEEYGLDKSRASRYMSINTKFSVDGNSPILQERYKAFNKSQMQEMLYLEDDQLEQVTPDMRVQDIRGIRQPKERTYSIPYFELDGQMEFGVHFPEVMPDPPQGAIQTPQAQSFVINVSDLLPDESVAISQQPEPQAMSAQPQVNIAGECKLECYSSGQRPVVAVVEDAGSTEQETQPLSTYGTPRRVPPEGSLITVKGCEGGHDCYSCHLECGIRQEKCYCVQAPMGNPFPCTTINVIGNIREEMGSRCQFVNLDLAYHRSGDHEPVPCCKECGEMCGYRCGRSAHPNQDKQEPEVIDAKFSEVKETEDESLTDLQIAQRELDRANDLLNKCLKIVPETDVHIRGMKIKVAALASLVRDMDAIENPPEPSVQPELPLLKNNDQRAAFVDAYETWPLWIETAETGERYYRYDLQDGTSMVVKVYHAMLFDYGKTDCYWKERYTEGYGRQEYYLLKPGRFFRDCDVNRSMLIEKLKEIQKKG